MTFTLRRAAADDANAIAAVHRRSMRTAMPWLPDLHTPAEDLVFFSGEIATSTCWVAETGDAVVAFTVLQDGWLRHLYVDPGHQGQGIGSALLDEAIRQSSGTVNLWAFQRNERALAFYRARGFVEIERTDGSGNEEREPDVLLEHR